VDLHVSRRQCIPAAVFARLRHPPAGAVLEGDQYCWEPPRLGLGDLVAAGLSAVGITPERVARLTGRPCGCKRRRQALNRLGRRLGIG
jgi:hypothetical protein